MDIHLIYGPTASGKSSLALSLAEQNDGVVINADSMQIYDALHILTAHPSEQEQAQCPHKLYGALSPDESCSAARWKDMASAQISETLAAGKTPLIVGGTGFYFKSLIEGLSPIPDVPSEIRDQVMSIQEEMGNPDFYHALSKKDPSIADKLNPNDTQRLIRAWEVLEHSGKSITYWQSLPSEGPPADWNFIHHFVNPPRDELYERCNARFDLMMEMGAIDEVKSLSKRIDEGELSADSLITKALGYEPIRAFLSQEMSLEEAKEQSKRDTRHYAKRQLTWFNNQF